MRISEQALAGGDVNASRQVMTRELLVRASLARHGEDQALRFRALHLNLPLVAEVADRLGLSGPRRTRTEHAALDGLHEAVWSYDPFGEVDFASFARPFVEWHIRRHLRTHNLRPSGLGRPAASRTLSRRTARPTRR